VDEIRVNKRKTITLIVGLIIIIIGPLYFVYFTDSFSDNLVIKFICAPVSIFLLYITYGQIRRLLIGPVITLTSDKILIQDKNQIKNYRWTDIKTIKVEEKTISEPGRSYAQIILMIWKISDQIPDTFNVSDIEISSDELRGLISKYNR
jgi:hypothetical protein